MAPLLLVLLAVLATASLSSAQSLTTKGTRFAHYTYASDVTGYVNMTTDYCDIKAAIAAGNFTAALAVYATGKNSQSGAVKRTFARFASAVHNTEPHWKLLTGTKNETWLDAAIRAAFNSSDGNTALGLIQVSYLKYFMHELDEAYTKIAMYASSPANYSSSIADDSGAPHNIDEAGTLWFGGNPAGCGTPSAWAHDLGTDMGTAWMGQAAVERAMTVALNDLLGWARLGDLEKYGAARDTAVHNIIAMGVQGFARSLYAATVARKCGKKSAVTAQMAVARVHLAYLGPMASGKGADVTPLEKAAAASIPDYKKYSEAIWKVASKLGFESAGIGAPKFSEINKAWKCKSTARP